MSDPAPVYGIRDREVNDPDLAAVDVERSQLDDLRAELTAPVDADDITLAVPGRPNYAVRYSTALTYRQLAAWQKKSTLKSGDVDELKLAALIVAGQCRAIIRDGVVVDDGGDPLTFRSQALLDMYEVDRVADVAIRFYGSDIDVANASNGVLKAAGLGAAPPVADDDDDEDETGPTRP